jgi:hypothetical protein
MSQLDGIPDLGVSFCWKKRQWVEDYGDHLSAFLSEHFPDVSILVLVRESGMLIVDDFLVHSIRLDDAKRREDALRLIGAITEEVQAFVASSASPSSPNPNAEQVSTR